MEFVISEEHRDELERAWYELNGLRILAAQFGSTSPFKPDKERYEYVVQKMVEANAYYQMVWQDILRTYLPDENLTNCSPTCDFATRTVTIRRGGEKN